MENIRYKITFSFSYIDQVDALLGKTKILQKSFQNDVTYFFDLTEDNEQIITYALYQITNHQIKIERLTKPDEEYEVGTDKPLGSKSAIDEN